MILTQSELKRHLNYNPESGLFTWRVPTSNRVKVGEIAGKSGPRGYLTIGIFKTKYLAHRLAFLDMTGSFPKDIVDHINNICNDNRWINLRESSQQLNVYNSLLRVDNTSGVKGVYALSNGKWEAKFNFQGSTIRLGRFNSLREAVEQLNQNRKQYHGEFANIG